MVWQMISHGLLNGLPTKGLCLVQNYLPILTRLLKTSRNSQKYQMMRLQCQVSLAWQMWPQGLIISRRFHAGPLFNRYALSVPVTGACLLRQAPHFGSFTDDQGGTLQDICMHAPSDITLTLQPFHRPAMPIWPARVMIDDITYQQLKNAAFQTYVPSSDSSREAGAGAGLNDND